MLGRRVLTLSQTFYDAAGLAIRVSNPDRLNAAILDTLSQEPASDPDEWERALGCVIDAERQTTFPLDKDGISAALDKLRDTFIAFQQGSEAERAQKREKAVVAAG